MALQLIELDAGFPCYVSGEFEARFIYSEIFQDRTYDQPGLPDAPFIIDVGANIGLFSLYMKRKYPDARILAFEPAPETFQALSRNVDLHGITGVTTYQYALGPTARTASLTYYPQMPGNSTFHPDEKALQKSAMGEHLGREKAEELFEATEVTVQVDRLSSFLTGLHADTDRIDLLKVDVEGAELEVLAGIDDADWERIQKVLLEISNANGALTALEDLLRSKGMTVTSEPVPLKWEELHYVTARR